MGMNPPTNDEMSTKGSPSKTHVRVTFGKAGTEGFTVGSIESEVSLGFGTQALRRSINFWGFTCYLDLEHGRCHV